MQHSQPQRSSRSPSPGPIAAQSEGNIVAGAVKLKARAQEDDRRGNGEAALLGTKQLPPPQKQELHVRVEIHVQPPDEARVGLGLLARLAVLSARLCHAHVLHVEKMGEQYLAQSIEIDTSINRGASCAPLLLTRSTALPLFSVSLPSARVVLLFLYCERAESPAGSTGALVLYA